MTCHGPSTAGKDGAAGLAPGAGLHGDVGVLRTGRRGRIAGHPGAGGRPGDQLPRHRGHVRRRARTRSSSSDILRRRRGEIVLATKFGIVRDPAAPNDATRRTINGQPAYVRKAVRGEPAPARHRGHRPLLPAPARREHADRGDGGRDGRAGDSRARCAPLGLSEVTPERAAPGGGGAPHLRAAERVLAVDPRAGGRRARRPAARWGSPSCPTARSAAASSPDRSAPPPTSRPDDFRRNNPRFQGEAFQKNLELVEKVRALAEAKGCTAGAARAGVGAGPGRGHRPHPRDQAPRYLEENLGALDVRLTAADLAEIDAIVPRGSFAGTRYPWGNQPAASPPRDAERPPRPGQHVATRLNEVSGISSALGRVARRLA